MMIQILLILFDLLFSCLLPLMKSNYVRASLSALISNHFLLEKGIGALNSLLYI